MIIHPDTNIIIVKLMIVKPPRDIDRGMIYNPKSKICKGKKGKLFENDN
jgi:hypothetical protein